MTAAQNFNIVIPLYKGFDALDVIGPYETLNWLESFWSTPSKIYLAAESLHPVSSWSGLSVVPNTTFAACPQPSLLFVPGGGPALLEALRNPALNAYIKQAGSSAPFVASVCSGAFLLAANGLLDGYHATTHWGLLPCLNLYPQIRVAEGFPRYIIDRNRVTGGGISSGLDESLRIVTLITGDRTIAEQIQIAIQYHPDPPYPGGDPASSPPPVFDSVDVQVFSGFRKELAQQIVG